MPAPSPPGLKSSIEYFAMSVGIGRTLMVAGTARRSSNLNLDAPQHFSPGGHFGFAAGAAGWGGGAAGRGGVAEAAGCGGAGAAACGGGGGAGATACGG